MFLGIEKHRKEKTAFIDDDKNTVTYQGVLDFCHTYSKNLKAFFVVPALSKCSRSGDQLSGLS